MRYHVRHDSEDRYSLPVQLAQHLLHARPRDCEWQHVERFGLDVSPAPTRRRETFDGFGNAVVRLELEQPYDELRIAGEVVLTTLDRPWLGKTSALAWESVRDLLAYSGAQAPAGSFEAQQYLAESPFVRLQPELAAYAGASFPTGRPLLDALTDLMHRLHNDVAYTTRASEPGRAPLRVLQEKRATSQDFAHLAIACLRAFGLAARFVSGYLRYDPPAGERRRAGADSLHAWLAVFIPDLGWVEADPVNDCLADQRHIALAWGRDFGDVAPWRGVVQGGGEHVMRVGVTVTPLDDGRGVASA